MSSKKQISIETKCIHEKGFVDKGQKMSMVMNPIYQGSTILYENYAEFTKNCRKDIRKVEDLDPFPEYGRIGNPTIFELANTMSKLEKGDFSIITNGGMSAVTTAILSHVSSGDHILLSDGTYTSTKKFIESICPKFGIEYSFYDGFKGEKDIASKMQKNTKAIFFESCASGTFEVENIDLIVEIAKKHKCVTICDNTLMTPILLNPITLGVDVVVHSLSKFVLGHADCMLGSITTTKKHFKKLYDYSTLIGNHASSQSAYMALRGIKTLALRVKDSVQRLKPVIDFLEKQKCVSEVLHPLAFTDKIRSANVKKYCKYGVPSLFSIVLDKKYDEKKLAKFFDSMQLFALGLSWGGFESLAIPYGLSHRIGKIAEYNNKTVIRIYIGMEDSKDLIDDLKTAFSNLS